MSKLFLLILICILHENFGAKNYRGYHVITCNNNDRLLDKIGLKEDYENDKIRSLNDEQSSIMIHPSEVKKIIKLLQKNEIDFDIVTKDLQRNFDEERNVPENAGWFGKYRTFDEILKWLKEKQAKHSKYSSLHNIGMSYYKKPVQVIKITGDRNKCTRKPSIWIDSGTHAREWMTISTGMYLIERLLEDFKSDPLVKYMRNTYDWYFLVVTNPDGYDYTWTDDRLWRKTRSPNNGLSCVGTDINRNFDFKWMTAGRETHPCSETYGGTKPFSEPETKAMADFILDKKDTWDLFISLHSFSQLWLTPWGYTKQLPENYQQMEKVAKEAVKAIFNSSGINYRILTARQFTDNDMSGVSLDWIYGVAKVPLAFAPELGTDFSSPCEDILPTGKKIWEGVKACIEKMKTELPPSCKP